MINNILITNVFGDLNKGDRALFEELIKQVNSSFNNPDISAIVRYKEELVSLYPNLELHTQISKTKITNKFLKLTFFVYTHLISTLYLYKFRIVKILLPSKIVGALRAYEKADLIISCPGGFLEDSNPSYYLNLYQLIFGIIKKKSIIIAPQSIGPIKSILGKYILSRIFSKVTKIFVREPESLDFVLNNLKINGERVILSPDLAFFCQKINKKVNIIDKSIIYTTVVNWNFPLVNKSKRDYFVENYKRKLISIYQHINNKYDKKIVILNQVATDLKFAYEIEQLANGVVMVDDRNYHPFEIIEKIGRSELFIGSRFHSCIFSILSNTPCIAISYLPKTTGMMKLLDLSEYQHDIYKLEDKEIIFQIDNVFENYLSVQNEFYRKIQNIQKKNLFNDYLCSLNKL